MKETQDWFSESRRGVFPNMALPLVNLVFLLLGFFLLAGRIESPPQAALDLIRGEGARSVEAEDFSLLQDGTVIYRRRSVSLDDVGPLWRARAAAGSERRAVPVIAADADAPARDLAGLLNSLSEADAPSALLLLRAR